MLQHCSVVWLTPRPYLVLLAALFLVQTSTVQAAPVSSVANPTDLNLQIPEDIAPVPVAPFPMSSVVNPTDLNLQIPEDIAPAMPETHVQIDPLDSPYPVPWNWVLATHEELADGGSGTRYYRSQSLVSPDGQYAAYSRIMMEAEKEFHRNRVSSVMFLENLQTGDLKAITAASPLSDNPFDDQEEGDMPGTISILMPVSWSRLGDRLLARQFEGIFSTSDASDYAVVWDRKTNRTLTTAPSRVQYDNAVLLGWSQTDPDRVLFRAGELGDEQPPVWAVNISNNQTALAGEDQPIVFGETVNNIWAGPQARW